MFVCVCMYVRMCVCTYVCVYIYIYILHWLHRYLGGRLVKFAWMHTFRH